MKRIIILLLTLLSISIFGKDNKKGITIENAYIKIVPAVSPNSVAFLTVKNRTNKDIELVKVESDVSRSVGITQYDNGCRSNENASNRKYPHSCK
jgi:copper(I)-binding protein